MTARRDDRAGFDPAETWFELAAWSGRILATVHDAQIGGDTAAADREIRAALPELRRVVDGIEAAYSDDRQRAGNPWCSRQQGNKAEILAHHAECDPQPFVQLDGWRDAGPDGLVSADKDNEACMAGHTWELRASPPELAVRVHIAAGTDHATAVRLLGKLRDWLVRDPELLERWGSVRDWPDIFGGEGRPGPVGAGSGAGGHGHGDNATDDSTRGQS